MATDNRLHCVNCEYVQERKSKLEQKRARTTRCNSSSSYRNAECYANLSQQSYLPTLCEQKLSLDLRILVYDGPVEASRGCQESQDDLIVQIALFVRATTVEVWDWVE